jgi:hypothetical protein
MAPQRRRAGVGNELRQAAFPAAFNAVDRPLWVALVSSSEIAERRVKNPEATLVHERQQ